MLTYKQAYNKIIDAYFKDEIKPYSNKFCFCGTLSPDEDWRFEINERIDQDCKILTRDHYDYSIGEFIQMENALLKTIHKAFGTHGFFSPYFELDECTARVEEHHSYENVLFDAMCAALDVLKEIHRERGEDVDEELTPFTKRNLVTQ